jgi:tetratricopeptide (TPR) repeat protein
MAHRATAFIYSHQAKTDEAKKEYFAEVTEFPKSPRAHLDLGVFVYFADKNYKAAADEYETALKLDPAYMPSYFRAGQITVFTGNLARGEELLRKYLAYAPKENEPSIARAHYWLGQVFEKQGKKAEAKASFATSLKLNPAQKDVAEALKRVS